MGKSGVARRVQLRGGPVNLLELSVLWQVGQGKGTVSEMVAELEKVGGGRNVSMRVQVDEVVGELLRRGLVEWVFEEEEEAK